MLLLLVFGLVVIVVVTLDIDVVGGWQSRCWTGVSAAVVGLTLSWWVLLSEGTAPTWI